MFKKTINYMNELVETKEIPGISFAFSIDIAACRKQICDSRALKLERLK